jgi:enoyl-CoA hydratase
MSAIEFEIDGHVAVITINRPEARNAVNAEVANGIEKAIDCFESDDSLWVAILTGVPPVFCAGADLKVISSGRADTLLTNRGGFAGFVQRERTKPLIAAVDGPALAGGTEICLAADLIVASESATFGIPEVKRSLVAGAGGLFRLPRKVPFNIAMELALTGDPISAERAHQFGFVNYLTEPGKALEVAKALARRIEANAPGAVRASRRVILAGVTGDETTGWALTNQAFHEALESEDNKEGLAAFIEKRKPVWTGR